MTYTDLIIALSGLGLFLGGGGLGFFISHHLRKGSLKQLEEEVAERGARRLAEEERTRRLGLLEEKDNWYKLKGQQEKELEDQLAELGNREKGLTSRDRELNNQREELRKEWGRFKSQERRLKNRERGLQEKEKELEVSQQEYLQRLELIGNLTAEEAREQLIEHLSGEVQGRAAAMIRAERIKAKEEADRESQKIIAQAIQRCAVEEVVQMTTSTVALPNEGIKSRIIGKEGRNVRAFEQATGVKVVVDDTPDTVLLSSYDPARREVAARAMKHLIADGGFTPNRIEEVVEKCRAELDEDMVREGKGALAEIGAQEVHAELPYYVGMLKYRASFGQNLLQHSLEVAQLAGLMAAEIGLDVKLARRAGLLHDIGKTVSREMEGSHVELGVDLSDRFGENPVVREVIAEHHEDNERLSPICFLVKAADTISSIRPGGRREDLEGYARRIMRLEEIANSFDGVKDVYAINAGREMRVMVKGDRIGDDDAEMLAFDIAERVKNELTFAGQVKVMVVRETRAVRYTGRPRSRRNGQRGVSNRRPRNSRRSQREFSKN
ncbi:MAG: ribonuclease Y [Gemmatimonadetes bacterium]|jgi:ribonucrease Y|nr:ribonuclease Y [Gemmatimonadota bacterium]